MTSSLRTLTSRAAARLKATFIPDQKLATPRTLVSLLLLAALAILVACGGGSTPPPHNPTAQTITFANPGAQTVGTPLTLSATASSGLPVSFASTTTSVCTVSGTTATFIAAGTCTIQATQAGNSTYAAATPVSQSFTVNATGTTAQTITFANPGAQIVGTPLTLSATASSGLTVSFASTTQSICTVTGTTATFIAKGSCTIQATQPGNSTYAAASPVPQTFTVNGKAQTITFNSPGAQTVGTPFTLSATATSGLSVSFASTTQSVCTVSGTSATFLISGTCTVQATQAGNSTWEPATIVSQSFTVNGKPQTITFANPGTQNVGTPLMLSASATSGLTVSFSSDTTGVCTVSGTTATFIATGTCTIEATQAGNSTWAAATTVPQSFTVNPALIAQTITFNNPGTQTVGTPLTLSATASSGLTVSFASTTLSYCTVSGTTATFLAAGTCTIQATQTGNSTYAAATPVSQSFTVNPSTADVTITIDPNTTLAISPYIYGFNEINQQNTGVPVGMTFNRQGGNRWTAYNWENNFSNAGADWGPYSNDNWLAYGLTNGATPAEPVRVFIATNQAAGMASLVTFQLQGYVSASVTGNVSLTDPNHLSTYFKQVVNKKSDQTSDPFTLAPPNTDAYVYMDEFAWALDQKFSTQHMFESSATLPTFISLDNEPDLWASTHPEVQSTTNISSNAFITKSAALAMVLKNQFPGVITFGPVNYGFNGLYNWQNEGGGGGMSPSYWFVDKYLQGMKNAAGSGPRLLDVYDFHWYSEAKDTVGERVTTLTGSTLNDDQIQAIVQSPRSLWDRTYRENSWIADNLSGPIYILGRIQDKISLDYPGTKLAVTEYENGGFNHIAGTVAQADNLGIFGAQGVFAANFWPPSGTYPYTIGAFRSFRGFNGSNANFGDTSIKATSSNVSKVAVYVSSDSTSPDRYVIVAINRSNSAQSVLLNGLLLVGTATKYQITATSAAPQVSASQPIVPVSAGSESVNTTSYMVTLPALSVTTIEVK